ncbi:NADH dehydrogenase I, E subunit [Geotalea daltonii FRC-32]|uniref:NADH dehydrogenase I, E subunit n=1 Tax=Geotalea daltonii (strain DSM 22248 / JCM 15807 / FRC-32) TaxID=316067 RepID=B9M3Y1_GEODF|nr:NADH-quinone oxidoreductase subunit NuoE [Geotalea daltonii]ACM19624.1 NADH dehydrogenase I, E subunit [Geotalea daltonii FRC-32]
MIPESLKKELASRIAHGVTPREAAVDVMKELQLHYGWLTDEAVVEAAGLLGLSPLQVEELATFYEMIYRQPVGKQVIHVCDSISCWAMGGETMMAHLAGLLGIKPGETTADGQFTLLPCACLGNCGDGPTMMIGEKIYGKLTVPLLTEMIGWFRGAAIETPDSHSRSMP